MNFTGKIKIDILTKHFRIHTIQDANELQEVLSLREQCFSRALERDSRRISGFDLQADHLVVRSRESLRIEGVYRITCSDIVDSFESSEDFDIQQILAKPGTKLELAWACITPEKRDGVTIALLWRGIAEYIRKARANVVFGVTSLFAENPEKLGAIQNYLQQLQAQSAAETPSDFLKTKDRVLPALLRAYIRAGAKVWSEPVFDSLIQCYDFMTVWELETCPMQVENHFRL